MLCGQVIVVVVSVSTTKQVVCFLNVFCGPLLVSSSH